MQGWTPTVGCAQPQPRFTGFDPNAPAPAYVPGQKPWAAASPQASLIGQPPIWAQALFAQYFGSGQGPTITPLN